MTASIATVHVTNDDRIAVDGRCVVITDTNGHTWSIACDDALVAFRFQTCFGKVREDMAVTKAERLDVLARVEAAPAYEHTLVASMVGEGERVDW